MAQNKPISAIRAGTRLALGMFLVFFGASLCVDAVTYSLLAADPISGRAKGCYTALDVALGLGPSEGGILRGTRLAEIFIGLPVLVTGIATFARGLWRSPIEVPVVTAASMCGTWFAGVRFFWCFHDTNVYLTWRIIRNTSNTIAAHMVAATIVLVNCIALFVMVRRATSDARFQLSSLRSRAYTVFLACIVPLLVEGVSFNAVWQLVVLVMPLLFLPSIMAITYRNSTAAV